MKRPKAPDLVVGLDVGTTKVCAIITEPAPRGALNVIGVGTAPSRGLRRGIVVNIDSTVEAIKTAIGEAEQMAGVEVRLGAEEWDERLARLEGVLAQVATQDVNGVDLRFKDQVVLNRGAR